MSFSLSVVSHGHGPQVLALLRQLAGLDRPRPARVLLTLNLPEPELVRQVRETAWPFELVLMESASPAGFGTNHNRAFARERQGGRPAAVFGVVNPDVRLRGNPFGPMLTLLQMQPDVGGAYARQIDDEGRMQDHERQLPTPARILMRCVAGLLGNRGSEVAPGQRPDWVNAAFLLIRSDAFQALGGFDEGYRMYCEDVDLCIRLQLAGWTLAGVDEAVVEHPAQRASHRQWRYFRWHLGSLLRLWRSEAYRAYLNRRLR